MDQLWQSIGGDAQKLMKAIQAGKESSALGYLHWDKLLHLDLPEGLTREEWWFGIKMSRGAGHSTLPLLRPKPGEPKFTYSMPGPKSRLLHDIDLHAGGRIEMPEQVTNRETKNQYYVSSLIEEAITSSQLEGATTTRKIAENLIRTGRTPRDRSEKMILNNYRTMQHISEIKDEQLSPQLVLDIHRAVTQGTLEDTSEEGRLRRSDEKIVVSDSDGTVHHVPPHADELEDRLEAMCNFANGQPEDEFIHPVLRSIFLHFWLGYDHPFVDGNGRAARALFYWSMLHQDYWLTEFISISQILLKAPAKYSRSFLLTETDDNDLTYFLLHQLEVITRSIEELLNHIKRRARKLQEVERRVRHLEPLNHRQRALLGHALKHPGHRYTIASHIRSHNVVHQTGRTDLQSLTKRGLLSSEKIGRTWYFTVPLDLEQRLASVGSEAQVNQVGCTSNL
jgi:Fic family protein